MVDASPRPSIRNVVPFEAYADLDLSGPRGLVGSAALLSGQVMQAVHGEIVSGRLLAVAFPDATTGRKRALGERIRVFGGLTDVEGYLLCPVVQGLCMAGLVPRATAMPVPNGVIDGIAYIRARPDKFLPGTWDRLDRRARARRKSGRGHMEEDDIARRREVLAERGKDLDSLPSFNLSSASTSQRYPVYVASRSMPPAGGMFTSYGLSDGDGAVPSF